MIAQMKDENFIVLARLIGNPLIGILVILTVFLASYAFAYDWYITASIILVYGGCMVCACVEDLYPSEGDTLIARIISTTKKKIP